MTGADGRIAKSLVNSMWRNKVKFNGFFFAVNMNLIRPAAVDDFTLFDPGNIMVPDICHLCVNQSVLTAVPIGLPRRYFNDAHGSESNVPKDL